MASTINASTTSTSGLVYNADASGVLQLQSNGTTGLTVGADASVTVNTVLQTANGRVEPLVLGTAQTAGGASVDFTGIPSWAKRITVLVSLVSTNGTSFPQIQIGSGSYTTTGYTCIGAAINTVTSGLASYTSGFVIRTFAAASMSISGQLVLTNISGNTWVCSSVIADTGDTRIAWTGGSITLSGVLDRLRLTAVNGTDTFDAGTVNIMYE
jgi:hypothetical protein